jgi:hypothetical protein
MNFGPHSRAYESQSSGSTAGSRCKSYRRSRILSGWWIGMRSGDLFVRVSADGELQEICANTAVIQERIPFARISGVVRSSDSR